MNQLKTVFASLSLKLLRITVLFTFVSACKQFEPEQLVMVETGPVTDIGYNSCSVQGEIYDIGENGISQYGFCWSETPNPSVESSIKNQLGSKTSGGTYSSNLTGLSAGTSYYIRAYASDRIGTVYGHEKSFNTMFQISYADPVTDFDGNIYQTVVIGEQTWMAENLKVTHYADGTAIPFVELAEAWDTLGLTGKAYCWYGNNMPGPDNYGALYTWATATNGVDNPDLRGTQGVCPDGWLLPNDGEWKVLEVYLGMSQEEVDSHGYRGTDEGGKLKEIDVEHWNLSSGATDEFGFAALPGGMRAPDGLYSGLGSSAYFWTAYQNLERDDIAMCRALTTDHNQMHRDWASKKFGASVRCVKDD